MPRYIHGHVGKANPSREYRSWNMMKNRCLCENHDSYPDYGGRGITICERWKNSFVNFLQDMGPRPQGSSLDRIDVNGNYEPGNCRWATPQQQGRNTRIHCTNTSGVKGLSWSKERNKWEVKIYLNNKTIHLGRFANKDDAIRARKEGEEKHWS